MKQASGDAHDFARVNAAFHAAQNRLSEEIHEVNLFTIPQERVKPHMEVLMEKDYEKSSDEELIVRLRDGESAITDYIMDKYKNLVRSKAKSMYILGADREDLIQEGMIGLFKAIRDYDTGRDASFFTFADLCVARQK